MNDLKFAFRQLLKDPGFTAVAVLTLGLGIAANATIFSFVNALLLRPPPVEEPGRLWQVWRQNLKGGSAFERYQGLSYPGYVYFRDRNQSFATLAAFDPETPFVSWSRDGLGQSIQCQFVSGNFFNAWTVVQRLGSRGAVAGEFRPVRRDRLLGVPAHPRNRHPHGAGGASQQGRANGPAPRDDTGRRGNVDRPGRGVCRHPTAAQPASWSQPDGSDHLHDGSIAVAGRSAPGLPYSSPTSRADRSDVGAAL
jgi:MacB-like periplasmic core domain